MAGSLGTISGQVRLDAAQAIAAFAAIRASSAETSGALDAAGGSLKKVGTITMGAGLAMLAGFGVAVKAAADFDTKMSYVQAVTHDSGAEMDEVRNKAMELGKTGQFSAGQIADGFVDLAKAGVTTKQMIGGMADAMVNLASAAVVPLDTAVDDLVGVIHTYGLSNTDAAHVSDDWRNALFSADVERHYPDDEVRWFRRALPGYLP
jgi:Phage-related minor tail protein